MIAKLGILVAALSAVIFVSRLVGQERRRVERRLSEEAARKKGNRTLERDPETGRYRARDEDGPQA